MAKVSNKELLEIAQDESTKPEQLQLLWSTSRSVKIRKAIASNSNANPTTLKLAARLYLEEVLENPAFELLRLFDDDKWVAKVGDSYEDPTSFLKGIGYYSRFHESNASFAKACLLSKNLNVEELRILLEYLPTSYTSRVIKNSRAKDNILGLIMKDPTMLTLEAVLKAYLSGIFDEEIMYSCLRAIGLVGSMSCRKRTYSRAVVGLLKESDKGNEFASQCLTVILLASRTSCIRWVSTCFKEKHLEIISKAIIAAKKSKKASIKSSQYSQPFHSVIKCLSGIVSGIVWHSMDYSEKVNGLAEVKKKICQLGLENHEWGESSQCEYRIVLGKQLCYEGLLNQDIRVKAFFVRSKCLGSWFHVQRSDPKYQIVEEVNNWLYERGGVENLVYNAVDLKKIVSISENTFIAP